MKNNTEQVKNLVMQALRSMPGDFALSDARRYLASALNEIQNVEEKRAKRNNVPAPKGFAQIAEQRTAQTAKVAAQSPQWTPQQVMGVVNYLDTLIAEEKKKLAELEAQKTIKPIEPEATNDFRGLIQG